jgi:hypothetical protein
LLQNGSNRPFRENVAREEQYGQAIDRGECCTGHHVGGARPDRSRTRNRARSVGHLRERRCGVDHRLFVAAQHIAQPWILLQRLAHSRNVSMPEDTKARFEKARFLPISQRKLVFQERDDCLRNR